MNANRQAPQRAQSVPKELDKPALHGDAYALPQEKPKVQQMQTQQSSVEKESESRKVKPSADWRFNRENREPRFEKIGDRAHE